MVLNNIQSPIKGGVFIVYVKLKDHVLIELWINF